MFRKAEPFNSNTIQSHVHCFEFNGTPISTDRERPVKSIIIPPLNGHKTNDVSLIKTSYDKITSFHQNLILLKDWIQLAEIRDTQELEDLLQIALRDNKHLFNNLTDQLEKMFSRDKSLRKPEFRGIFELVTNEWAEIEENLRTKNLDLSDTLYEINEFIWSNQGVLSALLEDALTEDEIAARMGW